MVGKRALASGFWVCLCATGLLLSCGQHAGDLDARVTGLAGTAQVFRYGGSTWDLLDTAGYVWFGDSVRVLNESYLELTFGEGDTLRFDENSKASFNDVIDTTGQRVLEVYTHYGTALSTIGRLPDPYSLYRVRTPDAVADAAGTQFCVRYELHVRGSEVDVMDGEVTVSGPARPDTVVAPMVVPAEHGVVVAWGGLPSPPERIGLIKWKRLERIMQPSFVVRRPTVLVVRGGPPGHARRPRVIAPARGLGRPVVKGRPARAPKVLRPSSSHKKHPAARPGEARGAVKPHKGSRDAKAGPVKSGKKVSGKRSEQGNDKKGRGKK